MILHSLKQDHPVAACHNSISEDLEMRPQAEMLNLILDEELGALRQRLLNLSYAYSAETGLAVGEVYQQLCEEMTFPASPAPVRALVARGGEQGLEDCGGRDVKDGQSTASTP